MKQHRAPVSKQVLLLNIFTSVRPQHQIIRSRASNVVHPQSVIAEYFRVAPFPKVPKQSYNDGGPNFISPVSIPNIQQGLVTPEV